MGQGTTAFLLGILLFQRLSALPDERWAWCLAVLPVLAWLWRPLRLPACVAAGFLWTLWHAHAILATGLPGTLEGVDLRIAGVVASLPERDARRTRFMFDVETLKRDGVDYASPGRVRLSWYGTFVPELRIGEEWQLLVRLKRPHGMHNPGGFDYEAWLFQQRVRATGYVRTRGENLHIGDGRGWVLGRVRQDLAARIDAALTNSPYAGIIEALAVGDRDHIDAGQWRILTRTGTNHLIAISGLHIGLIAGLAFAAVRRVWSRLGRLPLYLPAPTAAAFGALLAAVGYAALAGFSIPTQRALIMVTVAMATIILQRERALGHTLSLSLVFVLLWDPFSVMSPGFWLSFTAVAVILYGSSQRVDARSLWWRWGRMHVLVAIGLIPVMLVLFQRVPLASPLANALAVPWVGLVIVPLVLAGAMFLPIIHALGAISLNLAGLALGALWPYLNLLASLDVAQWSQPAPAPWTWWPALVGVILLLAPRGLPMRWLGLVWLLPLALIRPAPLSMGAVDFTLLDVGQGLSAVVRTRSHVLVYDTGPRFSEHFDAGSAAVVPYLHEIGASRIDMLVIGHGDNDHIGGAPALGRDFDIDRTISSVPERLEWLRAERCRSGQSWTWDGVRFEIIHPDFGARFRGNNASCVLRVTGATGVVLLPGDIEAPAEHALAKGLSKELGADILVAPHHGSLTSSTSEFIAAVRPRFVLFPVGYHNRYGFPRPAVVVRYTTAGARTLDSATQGAITFHLAAQGPLAAPITYRQAARRYWHTP